MARRFLWGAVVVALTMVGIPNVLAQDYPASQRVGVPGLAYQAPGTTPYAPLPSSAVPEQVPLAATGTTIPAAPGTAAPEAPSVALATDENNLFSQGGQDDQFAMGRRVSRPT